ncbi:S8 family peptidase [Veronia pacifica]|uniref:Peptidase S8/S53 domain-containing protein n=1 Tax=Veronia pacifica TaxID=1080227 RepID=A0A1C3EAQ8_9GAMM|nr:S8 family peptidase [Veronia pacifica]ODA30284.1 hypothetical protein A8L45_20345 [Veronia pacifica]
MKKKFLAVCITGMLLHPFSYAVADNQSSALSQKLYRAANTQSVVENEYIIKLKDGYLSDHNDMTAYGISLFSAGNDIVQGVLTELDSVGVKADKDLLEELAKHPDVEAIYPNIEFKLIQPVEQQTLSAKNEKNAPVWGLDRLDQRSRFLDRQYSPEYTGSNVTVYVMDTGVDFEHPGFSGRARAGFDAFGGDSSDDGVHGTHVAGTVASDQFGVANSASIVSVRVLEDGTGSGYSVLEGLNYVLEDVKKTGKRAVVNLSLGSRGGKWELARQAYEKLDRAGIVVVAAAGNDNEDACNHYPSAYESVLSVGSTTRTDQRSGFSNYGECVDVFAPGSSITSLRNGARNGRTLTIGGTSMASPHVAGLAAQILEEQPELPAFRVRELIINRSTKNTVIDEKDSPNRLAYSGTDLECPDAGCHVEIGSVNNNVAAAFNTKTGPMYFKLDLPELAQAQSSQPMPLEVSIQDALPGTRIKVGYGELPSDEHFVCESDSGQCLIEGVKPGNWYIEVSAPKNASEADNKALLLVRFNRIIQDTEITGINSGQGTVIRDNGGIIKDTRKASQYIFDLEKGQGVEVTVRFEDGYDALYNTWTLSKGRMLDAYQPWFDEKDNLFPSGHIGFWDKKVSYRLAPEQSEGGRYYLHFSPIIWYNKNYDNATLTVKFLGGNEKVSMTPNTYQVIKDIKRGQKITVMANTYEGKEIMLSALKGGRYKVTEGSSYRVWGGGNFDFDVATVTGNTPGEHMTFTLEALDDMDKLAISYYTKKSGVSFQQRAIYKMRVAQHSAQHDAWIQALEEITH